MRCALLQTHSAVNEELYRLTLPNHAEYCGVHGYDMIQYNISYTEAMQFDVILALVEHALMNHDLVFTVGSDVVITNPSLPLSGFAPAQGVAVVAQGFGNTLVNADTVIWMREGFGQASATLMSLCDKWQSHAFGIQGAFNDCIEQARPAFKLLPARSLQSAAWRGAAAWVEGDFAIHFFGDTNANKVRRVSQFLKTGTVAWLQ